MNAILTHSHRQVVAVVYDFGAASLSTIASAAGRDFEIVFVCDCHLPHVSETIVQARRLARVVDVTGLSHGERVDAVREVQPDGIVTYCEHRIRDCARLATALQLPGHSDAVVQALTDKYSQRQVLSAAGVQTTACALVGGDPRKAAAVSGFPAVLKPRVGAGSVNTFRVDSIEEFEGVLRRIPRGVDYVLEEMLQGAPDTAGASWGDYVSVESVHSKAGAQPVCITGKFPLAPPFREAGMFVPSTLKKPVADRVLELEAKAIKALGVRHGVTQTEMKLTVDGPKIIEINGRLGGYVPEILKRSSGVDLVHSALEVAVGRTPRIQHVRHAGVCYQLFLAPPPGTRGTFVRAEGLAELAALPGVIQVEERIRSGDYVDCQQGTQSLLGVVYGTSVDHEALREVANRIKTIYRPVFSEVV